ncbi:putative endonuclease III [Rozella allomycis CSF55]|uniref:Endonuclease III homolog n=1 Tax=Rozella allomycis (strain CSF55) TaxID=988480 RepID=A0A4P9YIG7_ROZAC|nr:putative endonuclease III [Rozella allomycis CSF55]
MSPKKTILPPKDWKVTLTLLEKMRESRNAPVDSLGCERLADKSLSPKIFRFQTLVSLMLSSQTKDAITAEAFHKLNEHCLMEYKTPLKPSSVIKMSEEEIDNCISKVGFHKRKAKYLKDTSELLCQKYDEDIPDTIGELTSLPGVGPKMAYITMQVAWKQNLGIGVDVHVHRISNRLKWVSGTKTPEDTRKELQDWLPMEYWRDINPLLVGFGQQICLPRNPLCGQCLLRDSCPSSSYKHKKV